MKKLLPLLFLFTGCSSDDSLTPTKLQLLNLESRIRELENTPLSRFQMVVVPNVSAVDGYSLFKLDSRTGDAWERQSFTYSPEEGTNRFTVSGWQSIDYLGDSLQSANELVERLRKPFVGPEEDDVQHPLTNTSKIRFLD